MPVRDHFVKQHFKATTQVANNTKKEEDILADITSSPLFNTSTKQQQPPIQQEKTIMEKEIFEQVDSIQGTMKGRVDFQKKSVFLKELQHGTADILRCKRIIVIGSGSSHHVAMSTRQLMEEMVELPVFIELASDFLDREVPIFRNDVCIFLSQSGETTTLVESCRYCLKHEALTIAVTNNKESTLSKMSDFVLDINAGVEHGITSTKTYTSQFMAMTLISLHLAYDKRPKAARIESIVEEMENLPGKISQVLKETEKYRKTALSMKDEESILVMGRGYQQGTCHEGSFKFKEITGIHSEGIHSGELKHGPLALIDDQIPIIMIVMRDSIYDKCCNAIQQVKARGGRPVLICENEDSETRKWADTVLGVPKTIDCLAGILTVIPLQLLSVYLAESMNKNVDQPPALVKTVVEKYIPNNRLS